MMERTPLSHTNIISLLGLENLPLSRRTKLVEEAVTTVQTKVLNRILNQLPEHERQKFVRALDEGDEVATADLLRDNGVDVASLAQEEARSLKEELREVRKDASRELDHE